MLEMVEEEILALVVVEFVPTKSERTEPETVEVAIVEVETEELVVVEFEA